MDGSHAGHGSVSDGSGWPRSFDLDRGQIRVWRFSLDLPAADVAGMERLLSDDEVERSGRFRVARHRRRFIVARGALRRLVGGYLGMEPTAVSFSYGERGKPELAGPAGAAGMRFNLSHTRDLALLAVGLGREVGVDVESFRENADCLGIARRYFSRSEAAALAALPADRVREAFFHVWTRKEAFVKARGAALSTGLDRFDVSVDPDEPARLIDVRIPGVDADAWTIEDLDTGSGFAAAVVVEGRGVEVFLHDGR